MISLAVSPPPNSLLPLAPKIVAPSKIRGFFVALSNQSTLRWGTFGGTRENSPEILKCGKSICGRLQLKLKIPFSQSTIGETNDLIPSKTFLKVSWIANNGPFTASISHLAVSPIAVKTGFKKQLSFYISRYNSASNSISSFHKRNISVLIRLDSVVRMIGITIYHRTSGFFETTSSELQGAKGMWCNGEIIMFKQVVDLFNGRFSVSVQPDFMSAYERMVSRGNLTNTKGFLILNEVRI